MNSRSVSVTGATGFVGRHIVEAFYQAGWRVRAIVRPGGQRPALANAEVCEAPLAHRPLASVIAGSDVIVHAAGLTRAGDAAALDRVNVGGTRAVVDAANDCRARLVHLSSQAAIGVGTIDRPARDADPPRPVNPYGRSKMQGERVVREHASIPWVILRPCAVYGPGDRQFLPLIRLAARGMFPLVGSPTFAITLVYVEDLARAVVLAAEHDEVQGDAMFIARAEPQTPEGLWTAMAEHLGRPYRPRKVPVALARIVARGGDVSWRLGYRPILDSARLSELTAEGFVCTVDRARARLGFTAEVPLPEGLARTVRWYRDRAWV